MQILFRRGTAALWTTDNPVLGVSERGYETDTGLWKTGNGSTAWNSLPYDPSTLTQLDLRYTQRRTILSVTTTLTLPSIAGQDVVAFVGAGGVPTMPTAVGNTVKYTVKNIDTASKTLATTGSQTIDGSSTLTISAGSSFDLLSDSANWRII